MNPGLPPQPPQPQFPHPMQQLPARPNQPSLGPPPPQAIPLPNAQPNRHVMSGSPLPPPSVQTPNSYMPGLGGPGVPLSSSYTVRYWEFPHNWFLWVWLISQVFNILNLILQFAPSSYGQPPVTFNAVTQFQPMPQMHAQPIPTGGHPASSMNHNTAPVTPIQRNGEQSSVTTTNVRVGRTLSFSSLFYVVALHYLFSFAISTVLYVSYLGVGTA